MAAVFGGTMTMETTGLCVRLVLEGGRVHYSTLRSCVRIRCHEFDLSRANKLPHLVAADLRELDVRSRLRITSFKWANLRQQQCRCYSASSLVSAKREASAACIYVDGDSERQRCCEYQSPILSLDPTLYVEAVRRPIDGACRHGYGKHADRWRTPDSSSEEAAST